MQRLERFMLDRNNQAVEYIESNHVTKGVECDVYRFHDIHTMDLAIIHIERECRTPLQKVISGKRTIEGYIAGAGLLIVINKDGSTITHKFPTSNYQNVEIEVGQTMQWLATEKLDIYELCEPPYSKDRFINL